MAEICGATSDDGYTCTLTLAQHGLDHFNRQRDPRDWPDPERIEVHRINRGRPIGKPKGGAKKEAVRAVNSHDKSKDAKIGPPVLTTQTKAVADKVVDVAHDAMTLGEVRGQILSRAWDKGASCPVCLSNVRVYRWSMYATAVRWLEVLAELGGALDFVAHQDLKEALRQRGITGTSETTRLRIFGLAETSLETRPEGVGRGGEWRCTEAGIRYLRGVHQIPAAVYVLHGVPIQWDETLVSISATDPEFKIAEHLS